jgi:hypothetical protein
MTVCLSKEGCQKNNITIAEALLLVAIHNNADLDLAKEELIKKGYITAERDDLFQQIGWRLTNKGTEVIDIVIADSDKKQEPNDRLINLATKLKEIFPKGKKDGTNLYWAEGVALIVRRLKLFFKKYGSDYDDDDIIKAAESYVRSFNGNYQYMKTLKYFIFKEKIGANREVEGESDLISYIENAGQEENLRNEWTSTLR